MNGTFDGGMNGAYCAGNGLGYALYGLSNGTLKICTCGLQGALSTMLLYASTNGG